MLTLAERFLQQLHDNERDNFIRLTHILKKIHSEGVTDVKQSHQLSLTVREYMAKMNRRMSFQELADTCKVHFDDYQFIDQVAHFAAESNPTVEPSVAAASEKEKPATASKDDEPSTNPKLENGFTLYINLTKIKTLCDIVMNLTRVLEGRDITAVNLIDAFADKGHPNMPLNNQAVMKHDPHLQKLLELIYTSIKSRFTIFANAFRYMDFRSRLGLSAQDFERGLSQLGLHLPVADRRAVFSYLGEGSPQLSLDHFNRLQTEASERNVDPFEL